MRKLFLILAVGIGTLISAAPAEAKKRDKDRDWDRDRDRDRYSRYDRDDDRYGRYDRDDDRRYSRYDRDDYRRGSYRGSDRSRTIYVIERNRPVRRVVYADSGGRYYRILNGRRSYISQRYYTSFPSRQYYSDGRPRISISF